MSTNDLPSDAAAEGATTLIEVLDDVTAQGFGGQLIAQEDGSLRCAECHETIPADEFKVVGFERLEGASDPDDMNIVVWGNCPGCGTGGVVTIGYGPNATPADQATLEGIRLEDVDDGGSTTPS